MVAVCRQRGAVPLPNISVRSKDSLKEVCIEWDHASLDLIGNAALVDHAVPQ